SKNIITQTDREFTAVSFLPKGSAACITNAAKNMVMAVGMAAHLVVKPILIKSGQINSTITDKNRKGTCTMPKGSANSVFPLISFISFGYPWVSIKAEGAIRKSARPKWINVLFFIHWGIKFT